MEYWRSGLLEGWKDGGVSSRSLAAFEKAASPAIAAVGLGGARIPALAARAALWMRRVDRALGIPAVMTNFRHNTPIEGVGIVILEDTPGSLIVEDAHPMTPGSPRFIRLRVQQVEMQDSSVSGCAPRIAKRRPDSHLSEMPHFALHLLHYVRPRIATGASLARFGVIASVLLFGAQPCAAQPEGSFDWNETDDWHPSIRHAAYTTNSPRLLSMHAVRIDLDDPAIRFTTTGRAPNWEADVRETIRERTVDFITRMQGTEQRIVAAINGNWYGPTGQSAGAVNLNGLAISNGVLVSPPWNSNQHAFVLRNDHTPDIVANSAAMNLESIAQAVSGYVRILQNGQGAGQNADLEPRTVIGMSADRRFVIMLVIDGRRPGHSLGATDFESGAWLRYFGAWNGINLDGGGSSTLGRWNPDSTRAEVLNIPTVQFLGFPIRQERFVGNHIGVYLLEEPPALEGYAAWADALGLAEDEAAPGLDLYGDGWANLFAYAFNHDPRASIHAAPGHALPQMRFTGEGSERFIEVDFRKNPNAADVTLSLEFATDLGATDWTPVEGVIIESLEADPVTGDPRWHLRAPIPDEPRAFYRLRATLP